MQSQLELTLSNAPRIEKLKFWMRSQKPMRTFRAWGKPLGLTGATLGRNCAQETMPVEQHAALVRDNVPVDLLPRPENRKSGPKPKNLPAQ